MNEEYGSIKQFDFYINDKRFPQVVFKYTTNKKTHEITKCMLYIKRDDIKDSEVFNFANMFYELVVNNRSGIPIQEGEIYDIFNNLKRSGNEFLKKKKTELFKPLSQLYKYPYLFFDYFNDELKKSWFSEQYEKNNVVVEYNQTE